MAASDGDYFTFTGNVVHSNAWYSIYANSGITIIQPTNFDADVSRYRNEVSRNVTFDNPVLLTNRKAKALASLLKAQSVSQKVPLPWLEPLVFLAAQGGEHLGRAAQMPEVVLDRGDQQRMGAHLDEHHPVPARARSVARP